MAVVFLALRFVTALFPSELSLSRLTVWHFRFETAVKNFHQDGDRAKIVSEEEVLHLPSEKKLIFTHSCNIQPAF